MDLTVLDVVLGIVLGSLLVLSDIASSRYRYCKGTQVSMGIWMVIPVTLAVMLLTVGAALTVATLMSGLVISFLILAAKPDVYLGKVSE